MNPREVADRQAIHDLLVDYCLYLDRMELDALATLFTRECQVVYGEHPLLQSRGRMDLAQSLERMWRWTRTSHHLGNVRLWFTGDDSARTTSYVLAWHERKDGSTATIYGQYQDLMLRTADGWRIAERRMLMNGDEAGFSVPIAPLERRRAPDDWETPALDE